MKILTPYEAADLVQRTWNDFSIKAIAKVIDMDDRLIELPVSENTIIRLIGQLSRLPPKPGLIKSEASDD